MRGQAFETMMLVISVIVALAILNVLMGIIQGVQVNIIGTPDDAMHDALRDIVKDGYGYSTPLKATLKKATRLDMRSVTKNDLPELDPTGNDANIKFCVNTEEIPREVLPGGQKCSGGSVSQGTTSLGPASQDVAFYFVICGNSDVGRRGGYRIWIGGTAQSAGACQPPTQQ